jgi:hypothetical protein
MIGDGDVVERHEARTGDVHRLVLAVAADVQEHKSGIVEMLREPGGADEHLVALSGRGERGT